MYYGTNSIINIQASVARFLHEVPDLGDTELPKFYSLRSPAYNKQRETLSRYLGYQIQKQGAEASYRQDTMCTLHAVASRKTTSLSEQLQLWGERVVDTFLQYILQNELVLYNYEALCTEEQWETFIITGNFSTLVANMALPPDVVGDPADPICLHPISWGDVIPVTSDSAVEVSLSINFVHGAIDNIPTHNDTP